MMSSSANPRKFSEKIAIQQRKLNEEQSAFQQIMHEVHTITRFPTPVAAQALGAPSVSWNQRVAGSLPNVFEIAYHAQRPDLQAFANPLLYSNQWPGTSGHPNTAAAAAAAQLMIQTGQPNAQCPVGQSPMYLLQQQQQRDIGLPAGYQRSSHPQPAVHRGRSPGSHPHYHPYRTPSPHHSPGGSAVGSPNLRARSPDRPQLTPPCQSASYLVPPQDSGWRRTHSDPGIHASVTNPNIVGQTADGQLSYPSSAMNHMNSLNCNSPNVDVNMSNAYLDPKLNLYYPGVQRSKPDDPAINMQTLNINSGDLSAGSSQASISSNTGSLPDLTQVPPSTTGQPPTNFSNPPPPQQHQQQPLHYSQSLGYGQSSSSTTAALAAGFHPTGVNSDLGSPSGVGGPIVSHQQRHSIQLPVQYAQGQFAGAATTGNAGLYSFPGSQSSSPGYQADSPHSGPNSPATTTNSESPGNASQQGQSSPGSPYYSLPAQLQNINIDASDFQPQQSVYISGDGSGQQQLQFRVPVNPNLANQYQQMNCSAQYQIQTNMVTPPPYQPPGSKIAQQQPCDIYGQMQPPLSSPNSGKIPNIILTGPCDTNAASTSATFVDPAVAMLSSDLRLTLDPSDLESLQVLSNEHDLIDADTEDALRGDRI